MTALPLSAGLAAFTGNEAAKTALLLAAINPALRGVLLAGAPGTAKTTLLRSFAALLEPHEVIATCPAACDPARPWEWCSDCRRRYRRKQPPTRFKAPPWVELPLHAGIDRLLGGIDMEATLIRGQRVAGLGLLEAAHRGVLVVNEINLLERSSMNQLLATLSSERIVLEREGLSESYPARFLLLGSYDPAEGELRRHLLDRVGLLVPVDHHPDAAQRRQVIQQNLHPPISAAEEHEILRRLVQRSKTLLTHVELDPRCLEELARAALRLGVEGNRADIFAAACAAASAALHGRTQIEEIDLKIAIRLVLEPRAIKTDSDSPSQPEQAQPPEQSPETDDASDGMQPLEDTILQALDLPFMLNVMNMPRSGQRQQNSGSRGETENFRRGRHIRSVSGRPERGRIAITATLLAAAPFQRQREQQPASTGIRIHAEDIRIKLYRDKAGTLFIFAVDASGSMALNRMRQAKGAVIRLLKDAYIHRDTVALLAFRGKAAELLLPPSQSVERARRALDVLPVGGGTPLGSALLMASNLAAHAHSSGTSSIMLILLTDGRANVPLKPAAQFREQAFAEIERIAIQIRQSGVLSLVIDTQRGYTGSDDARRLAVQLGGRYLLLPDAAAAEIATAVKQAATG